MHSPSLFLLSLIFSRVAQAGAVRVPTPYHWLEHPEAEEVKAWVDAQNKVTDAHLGTCTDKKKIADVRLCLNVQSEQSRSCVMVLSFDAFHAYTFSFLLILRRC